MAAGAQVAPGQLLVELEPRMIRAHPALTDEHEAVRETMRRFVAREITPHAAAWDEAEEFPRELYSKAAAAGLLGIGFPEEYGGTPADLLHRMSSSPRRSRSPASAACMPGCSRTRSARRRSRAPAAPS